MRKIISQEEKDKKLRRNQLIIGIVLIGLMISSTIGFAFINKTNSSVETVKYNGIKFVKDSNGYWSFNINDKDFLTLYNPEETKDIESLNSLTLNDYSNKPLYFIGEPGEHFSELVRNLDRFVLRISEACLQGEECERDLPIKDCNDNIIIFRENLNETEKTEEKIYQEGNCVYIVASFSSQARYADRFLFDLLEIE